MGGNFRCKFPAEVGQFYPHINREGHLMDQQL